MSSNRVRYALLAALFLLSVTAAWGQTNRGIVAGSVLDASGAAVPDATVKIEQKATGFVATITTPSSGDFTFPDLLAGVYTVTVSRSGFQTQQIKNVEVEVAKTTSLPITLRVAQQMQTVEVTGVAARLETNESALNAVVPPRAVQDIPLNGRDFRQLLALTPGFTSGAGNFESQNGNRSNQNNWQIDGVDNNDFWHNFEAVNQGSISNVAGVLLPVDAIQEFNQQSVGGADFGRNPGSMINVVIKSGTNDLHGTLYYFHRNEYLAATSPFTPPGAPSELRNHNFGGSVGGPIMKDKAFFFLTYEGQRFITPNAIDATVPSQAWVNKAEALMAQFNVPVNPVMTAVLANFWPSAITSAPATSPNFFSGDRNNFRSNNFLARIDYNFTPNERFFFRSFVGTGDATQFAGSVYGEYFQAVPSRQSNWAAILTSALTPRVVNQVLVGVNYFLQNFDDANHGADPPALGFNTGVTSLNFGTPNIELTGFTNGGVGETPNLGRTDTTWHVTDDLSYARGSHALKFGGEFRRAKLFVHYLREARGAFLFEGIAGPWGNPNGAPENALADFLAGFIAPFDAGIATGNPLRNYYVNSMSGFAQDNWQYSPRLNLSLGVRYDYNGLLHDPTHTISTFLPTFTPTGLAFPGQPGSPVSGLYPKDRTNFAPRLGFAFSPQRGGKTVIRGAWGIYYDIVNGNLFIDNRAKPGARGVSRNPAGPNPVFTVSNSNMITIVPGQFIFGSVTPTPPFGAYGIDQGVRSPYVQNFSLNVQRQLTRSTVLQIGYVGSQARRLIITRNMNQPAPSATKQDIQAARPFNAVFPQFSGITQITSSGNAHYNSLQASLRSTSWHGLAGQVGYTLGHAMDDMSFPRNNRPTDNNNVKGDFGNADSDTRHNLGGYLVYDVPQVVHSFPRLTKGWQLNAFVAYNSGFPFPVLNGGDNSHTGNKVDRADQVGSAFSGIFQPAQPPGLLTNGLNWINFSAFAPNAAGTFGNTRRNQFYGPNFRTFDFSVFKNTPITEKLNLQIRAEMFNLFNFRNFAHQPDNCICDGDPAHGGSFGLITSTIGPDVGSPGIGSGEPFNAQLAIKFIW